MPNSFYAHMLIEYSKEQNLQNKITENLFTAFFMEGKDIGDIKVLLEIADKNNIDNFTKETLFLKEKI